MTVRIKLFFFESREEEETRNARRAKIRRKYAENWPPPFSRTNAQFTHFESVPLQSIHDDGTYVNISVESHARDMVIVISVVVVGV